MTINAKRRSAGAGNPWCASLFTGVFAVVFLVLASVSARSGAADPERQIWLMKVTGSMDLRPGVIHRCEVTQSSQAVAADTKGVAALISRSEEAEVIQAVHFARAVPSVEYYAFPPEGGGKRLLLSSDAAQKNYRANPETQKLIDLIDKACN